MQRAEGAGERPGRELGAASPSAASWTSVRKYRGVAAFVLALALLGARPALATPEPDNKVAAPAPDDTRAIVERIAAILAAIDDEASAEKATMRLRALGPDGVPSVFAVLAHGRISADGPLTEKQQDALLGALGRFAGPTLFGFLSETIPWSEDVGIRVTGLRVLGRTARAAQLSLVLDSAVPPGADADSVVAVARPIEKALDKTLRATLGRDPTAFDALARAWFGLPSALRATVVRAVGRAGTKRGLGVLQQILVSDPAAAPLVMGELVRLASLASPRQARVLGPIVRDHIRSDELSIRQAAAIAAGRLRDTGSVPALVEALSDDSRGVRENSLWALRAITDLELRADPLRWIEWYDEETTWFAEEGAAVKRDLAAKDRSKIAAAVRRAATRPLHRDEFAGGIARVLRNKDAGLRTLACRALATLGARGAMEDLVPLLEDPEEPVRAAAHRALASLSRLDLPADSEAWHEALLESE